MPTAAATVGDAAASEWKIALGESIDRAELHRRCGGRIHPRVSPARRTRNVFLFTTPAQPTGLFDGFTGEHVHFTGEGRQTGTDQVLTQGNKCILHHHAEGRTLRLFHQRPDTTKVTYLGQLHLDSDRPFVWADAPSDPRRPLEIARRLVFRLRPVLSPPPGFLPTTTPASWTPRVSTDSKPALFPNPSSTQRAAASLLASYNRYLRATLGINLVHYWVRPAGTLIEISSHYDPARKELLAVRHTLARAAIWAALGELQDASRFMGHQPARAIILPSEPDQDLAALLHQSDVAVIWPIDRGGFARTQRSNCDTRS
ncbi:hypothetical protein ABT160_38085 [Streptomyces sp. NPDC001941]|uniref:hypothetical protein n=1 Tax=Streptomyces sp. NPDC001941 TaxID=3154659 RepID=UPI0033252D80